MSPSPITDRFGVSKRPELVVGDLHERQQVDVLAHQLFESALVPAARQLEHDTDPGRTGEHQRVAQGEHEADVGAQRVRRLDRERDAELVRARGRGRDPLAELVGRFLPRARTDAARGEPDGVRADRGAEVERLADHALPRCRCSTRAARRRRPPPVSQSIASSFGEMAPIVSTPSSCQNPTSSGKGSVPAHSSLTEMRGCTGISAAGEAGPSTHARRRRRRRRWACPASAVPLRHRVTDQLHPRQHLRVVVRLPRLDPEQLRRPVLGVQQDAARRPRARRRSSTSSTPSLPTTVTRVGRSTAAGRGRVDRDPRAVLGLHPRGEAVLRGARDACARRASGRSGDRACRIPAEASTMAPNGPAEEVDAVARVRPHPAAAECGVEHPAERPRTRPPDAREGASTRPARRYPTTPSSTRCAELAP